MNLIVDLFGKGDIFIKNIFIEGKVDNKFYICAVLGVFLSCSGCASSAVNKENGDMLESYNRTMFSFNSKLERYVMRPVANGYRTVTNEFVRRRISNFFNNIEEPISAVNHVLQGEFSKSGNDLGRFVINTTLGGVGLFDVASDVGLEREKTGFDQTLANWCVPDGPFVVLPVFGPSTPRAATGFVVDGYSSPMYWAAQESGGEDAWLVYYGMSGLKYLNLYAENVKLLESLEEGSVDYYETMKSAYLQNRKNIKSCAKPQEDAVADYDFDMEDFEE